MAGRGNAKGRRKKRSSAASISPDKSGSETGTPGYAKPSHGGGASKPSAGSRTSKPASGLYLVATPIGNARDITLRALDALGRADVIACEDTRVTAKLLAIHGISRPLTPYHEHNAEKAGPKLIKRLKKGDTVALVSDAGTPLVSDPGYKLVRACLAEGIAITPLPGASSVLTALVVSGLPPGRFFFAGFLPPKRGARKKALGDLAAVPATLVFFESPRRLAATLADMAEVLGGARAAAVARELTKKFEQVRRAPLGDLARQYAAEDTPKGEVVVLVGPPDPATAQAQSAAALDGELARALATLSVKDAAREVAARLRLPRREVYARALELARR